METESSPTKQVYLSCSDPWDFENAPNKEIDKTSNKRIDSYLNGEVDSIEGYIFVFGAKIEECNGLYHFNDSDNTIYSNHYTKSCSKAKHFLKFSLSKGIKIVPKVNKYRGAQDYYWWGSYDDRKIKSPKNDEKISNLRWNLIQNTKKQINDGINIEFINKKPTEENENTKELKVNLKTKENEKKYYEYLMNIESFEYEYYYRVDNNDNSTPISRSNRLINVSDNNDIAYYYFIRNFTFSNELYPKLNNLIPKTYERKEDINKLFNILNEYFNGIDYLTNLMLYEFLPFEDTCIHSNITHLRYDIEGKNEIWYHDAFLCDKCEIRLHIPYDSDSDIVNEQLSFISRVKRSFGLERNGRKSSHRNRYHTFKLKKYIYDTKFNGMTHIYNGINDINIHKNDNTILQSVIKKDIKDKPAVENVIGTLKQNDKMFVLFSVFIDKDSEQENENILAIRTIDNIVGYIKVKSKDYQSVKVSYEELEKFINDNNIIISQVRISDNKNPIERIKYSMGRLITGGGRDYYW